MSVRHTVTTPSALPRATALRCLVPVLLLVVAVDDEVAAAPAAEEEEEEADDEEFAPGAFCWGVVAL